jgi:ComF family protein
VTNFHFEDKETVKKMLYGRIKLQNATALLHFSKKGIVQELLHNLKYRGHEQIGYLFGKWLGVELKSLEDYSTIDVVVPVPLHKSKLRQRGYNQVTKFGQEIATALDIDFNDKVLVRQFSTATQVFKSRLMRSDDSKSRFKITEKSSFEGKHILLVDDIITTGATIEACANELLKIPNVKLSLATMAIAD